MAERTIRVPASIPIIGQGPSPERAMAIQARLQAQSELVLCFAQRAFEAMRDQFAAKSRSDEEMIQLCKKAWKIGIFMMRTSPFGSQGASDEADLGDSGDAAVGQEPETKPAA